MKEINWNKASEFGLIERINRELLHPLGLAMTRDPNTGSSTHLLVADDGIWKYSDDIPVKTPLTKEEIQKDLIYQV